MTFVSLGDFPTSHAKLRELLSGVEDRRRSSKADNGYPFDWLRDFTKVAQENTIAEGQPSRGKTSKQFRPIILKYLDEIGVDDAASKLETFGKTLAAAAPLRNDSNYEALLIAHEYEHGRVTKAFIRLAKDLSKAAECNMPFVIDAFNHFICSDPDLDNDREKYKGLLYTYREVRINAAIRKKLGGSTALDEKLRNVISLIEAECTIEDYKTLEDKFSWHIFQGKASIMNDFENNIESFESIIGVSAVDCAATDDIH